MQKVQANTKLDPRWKRELERRAEAAHMTTSAYIRERLMQHLYRGAGHQENTNDERRLGGVGAVKEPLRTQRHEQA